MYVCACVCVCVLAIVFVRFMWYVRHVKLKTVEIPFIGYLVVVRLGSYPQNWFPTKKLQCGRICWCCQLV